MVLPLIPTTPTPLSMVPEFAFVEVNVSLECWPTAIVVGLALNVAVGGFDPFPPPDPAPQPDSNAARPKSIADSFTHF